LRSLVESGPVPTGKAIDIGCGFVMRKAETGL
jgi:hypothetical protein